MEKKGGSLPWQLKDQLRRRCGDTPDPDLVPARDEGWDQDLDSGEMHDIRRLYGERGIRRWNTVVAVLKIREVPEGGNGGGGADSPSASGRKRMQGESEEKATTVAEAFSRTEPLHGESKEKGTRH
ncbi:amidotransferase 1, exosortase A system-associated [Sesbania bispinosa]|nr:amidotransferase 1, exosortase A system-associated [Sesbania bispinosa]